MRLIQSPFPNKKWRAVFKDGSHTDFGDSNYEDFTQHKDETRRELYKQRHQKDLETKDPRRAGFLSFYILWNKPTIEASLQDYKARFGNL